MKPIYWGIFVPNFGGKLDRLVPFQHVTYGFKTEWPEELWRKPVDIWAVAYGNDGVNEAYAVRLPKWTRKYYSGARVPHITLSTAWSGKPVDSWKLEFSQIDPFKIEGMFGYFDGEALHL